MEWHRGTRAQPTSTWACGARPMLPRVLVAAMQDNDAWSNQDSWSLSLAPAVSVAIALRVAVRSCNTQPPQQQSVDCPRNKSPRTACIPSPLCAPREESAPHPSRPTYPQQTPSRDGRLPRIRRCPAVRNLCAQHARSSRHPSPHLMLGAFRVRQLGLAGPGQRDGAHSVTARAIYTALLLLLLYLFLLSSQPAAALPALRSP